MQKKLMLVAAGLMLAAPAPLWAQGVFRGTATLATPVAAERRTSISGVEWTCVQHKCTGTAERYATLDSMMKECRKVSAALGPLAAYASRGRVFSAVNVKACNRAAHPETAAQAGRWAP